MHMIAAIALAEEQTNKVFPIECHITKSMIRERTQTTSQNTSKKKEEAAFLSDSVSMPFNNFLNFTTSFTSSSH